MVSDLQRRAQDGTPLSRSAVRVPHLTSSPSFTVLQVWICLTRPGLRSYACYQQDGLTPLNTAEWWRWPWGGAPFTIPAEHDGSMDQGSFHRLLADMATLAPKGWEFPDPFNGPGGH